MRTTMLCLGALAAVGCQGNVKFVDGGSGGSAPVAGSIQLALVRAAQTSQVGLAPSDPNSIFLTVELTLANGTDQSAPLAGALFHLATADGLEVFGDPATAFHPRGCQQTASVVANASVTCVTVFRVAPAAVPVRLTYQTVDGRKAAVDITTFARCKACGNACVDVSGDDAGNCGACGAKVGLGTCQDGQPVCNPGGTACGGACVDLQSDKKNCGACGAAVGKQMSCIGGQVACTDGTLIPCGGQCVSPTSGVCGSCARVCSANASCSCTQTSPGVCVDYNCRETSLSATPCNTLCGSLACMTATPRYHCPDGSNGEFTINCNATPAPTSVSPINGQTCAFTQIECACI